jgi:quinoprotein glucose dehydrogenase
MRTRLPRGAGEHGELGLDVRLPFLAATKDDFIRAFDVSNGRRLWQARLPAGGQATPMTYVEGGRQYVVIAAGGHGSFGTKAGDYVIAYALP